MMLEKVLVVVSVLLGVFLLGNGGVMIVAPERWYWAVPGVADRGPFNPHFVIDIGIIYVLIGAAFLYGAYESGNRFFLWLAPTLWLAGHAIFHYWEVFAHVTHLGSIAQDFPGVTMPALVGIGLSWFARRSRAQG